MKSKWIPVVSVQDLYHQQINILSRQEHISDMFSPLLVTSPHILLLSLFLLLSNRGIKFHVPDITALGIPIGFLVEEYPVPSMFSVCVKHSTSALIKPPIKACLFHL